MVDVIMTILASLMNLAGPDLFFILLIVLVLFGAKKLPELARGMGQAVKEFQKAKDEFDQELHTPARPDTTAPRTAQATVPRIENVPVAHEIPRDPAAARAGEDTAANDI